MNKDDVEDLIREARLDAKAFRENTVYDGEGDAIRLIANAERLDQYADALTTLSSRVETLEAEVLEWKTQHENLLSVRQQDLSAMQAKIDGLQKDIAFKNEAMRLTKGCPGKVVLRNGFYKIDCYKKKYARQALAGDTNHG